MYANLKGNPVRSEVDDVRQEHPPQGSTRIEGAYSLLLHNRLLGKRLYIHAWVRFLVAACIVGGAWFAEHVVGIVQLNVQALQLLGVVLGVYNAVVFLLVRRYQTPERAVGSGRLLTGLMHFTIAVDFVFLTVALWLVGGTKSPFKAFYCLHVIIACFMLSPWAACGHALFGYLLLSGLVVGQWQGWIPLLLPVGAVNSAQPLDGRYVLSVLMVQALFMSLSLFLMTGLKRMLEEGERVLRTSNAELRRLSNMKRDFLHIALHDLKAPTDAVAMLLDNLAAGLGGPLTEQQAAWVERCRHRLREQAAFIKDFQILAVLDSAAVQKQGKSIDIAALLHRSVEEYRDLAQAHQHALTAVVDGDLPPVYGIERLIHEAVANLITNAIKYTPDGGTITVRGAHRENTVRIEVEDNGIGISSEDKTRLFEEFVRLRPGAGSPEKEGSGLGLSIVRRIIEIHGGRVDVTSEPNVGSKFTIELPARKGGRSSSTSA